MVSQEETQKTESMSVAPGDGSSMRLSPFNKDFLYKYPHPVGVNHRQTMQTKPRRKLVDKKAMNGGDGDDHANDGSTEEDVAC